MTIVNAISDEKVDGSRFTACVTLKSVWKKTIPRHKSLLKQKTTVYAQKKHLKEDLQFHRWND